VAPELLGAQTIGRGSARPGGGGWGNRSQISLLSRPKYKKTAKKGGFVHFLAEKSPKTPFFAQKYLTRYTHEMFFEEYINF
jgi:phage pi2 protein 07